MWFKGCSLSTRVDVLVAQPATYYIITLLVSAVRHALHLSTRAAVRNTRTSELALLLRCVTSDRDGSKEGRGDVKKSVDQ